MAVGSAPESFHSVTLSVDGHAYTANIWRGSADLWRLLSVEVHGFSRVATGVSDFASCRASLEAAEQMAKDVLSGMSRHGAA